jgi:hypothetical protein
VLCFFIPAIKITIQLRYLIGDNHFDFVKYTSSVVAYKKIGPIESNNLPVNALGIFDNPAFGTTTANFATQIVLESANPTIGKNGNRKCFNDSYFSTKIY